ncbi:MAG: hypothetical protein ABW219_03235 [Ilumatobacteraceae bacterium]
MSSIPWASRLWRLAASTTSGSTASITKPHSHSMRCTALCSAGLVIPVMVRDGL